MSFSNQNFNAVEKLKQQKYNIFKIKIHKIFYFYN